MDKQTTHKLRQATIARDYARKIGDKRLAARMAARVNAIISNIAFGA
jgi:hypothetical protein